MGDIIVELDQKKAPITVANFLSYVDKDGYQDTIFHRVVEGFMVQGGGHRANMREIDADAEIKNEADNGMKNITGTVQWRGRMKLTLPPDNFLLMQMIMHF